MTDHLNVLEYNCN